MNYKRSYLSFLLALILIGIIGCSLDVSDSGGGSEVGNGIIAGTVFSDNGTPAVGISLCLLPSNYVPFAQIKDNDLQYDTTDESGAYSFKVVCGDTSLYNIEAFDPQTGNRALISHVEPPRQEYGIKYLPQAIAKDVGTVVLYIPDSLNTKTGYTFIKGTTWKSSLEKAKPFCEGFLSLAVDSIPESTVPCFYYDMDTINVLPHILSDTVEVIAKETTYVDAFLYWAHYTTNNSTLPQAHILDLYIDEQGNVWLAIDTEGVFVLSGTQWHSYNEVNSSLPNNIVYHITGDKKGTLWFATYSGAACLKGDVWQTISPSNSELPSDFVNQIEIGNNGVIWFATEDGVASLDGDTWAVYRAENSNLPSNIVKSLAVSSDGSVWFATYQGVAHFNHGKWIIYNTQNSKIASDNTFYITIDTKQSIWVGYFWECGVSQFMGSSWNTFDWNHSPVLDGTINQMVSDSYGNLWVATKYGLTKFNGKKWDDLVGKRFKQLQHKQLTTIDIDKDDNKWLGTWSRSTVDHGVISFGPTIK